jgi:hypothetical protein
VEKLQLDLAAERKAHAQAKISLKAYEAELSQLLDERESVVAAAAAAAAAATATTSNGPSAQLQQETIDSLRRQVASLADSLRVKSDEVRLLEDAFSQLKLRYDEALLATKAFKQNEQQLIAALSDSQTQLALSQTKFRALRVQAQEKLTNASNQIDAINGVSEREIAVLKAKLLKAESMHHARDDAWQQKDAELKIREAEVRNLTALCDELIAKLEARGGGGDQR